MKAARNSSGPVRVLITHDNASFRSGLRSFLDSQENIEVVGEADNGTLTIEVAKLLKPDLILMDISMPGVSGPEVFRSLKRVSPKSKLVMVNVHDEAGYRDLARQMGLSRFVSKRLLKNRLPEVLGRLRRVKDRASSRDRRSSTHHHHA
ncbi:MAG TPA: response regulator transcription factor [Bacteroidota bacterium]|jgi:DNA-binding NarL/FixJ family response regulator